MAYYENQRLLPYGYSRRAELTIHTTYNVPSRYPPRNYNAIGYKERVYSDDFNNNNNNHGFQPYLLDNPWQRARQPAINYPSTSKWYAEGTQTSNRGRPGENINKPNRICRRRNFGKNKSFHNKLYNDSEARNLANRLKDVESINGAIDELCTSVNVRNKQPMYAVLHELFLIDKEKEIKNIRTYCDQSTQTFNLKTAYKKEICTPIPERVNDSNYETPINSNKKALKLEKITPMNK